MAGNEEFVGPRRAGADEPFGTMVVRRAWTTARHAGVGEIDPRQIQVHRFQHEFPALALALLVFIGAAVAGSVLISPKVALGLIGLILFQAIIVPLKTRAMLGRSAEVTASQFANLYALIRRQIEVLGAPRTRMFVIQDPAPYAFSFGLFAPFGIVLTSSLVEGLDEAELSAVIAHELGHIKLGHTRINRVFGNASVPLGIPYVEFVIRVPFLWWMRCTEWSADRAAYAATRRVSKVISSLVKMSIGPRLSTQVRPEELSRQAEEFYRGWWATITQLKSAEPFLVSRIQQIVDFAGPPESDQIHPTAPTGSAAGPDQSRPAAPPAERSRPTPAARPSPVAGHPDQATETLTSLPQAAGWATAAKSPIRAQAWLAVSLPSGGRTWHQLESDWVTVGRADDNALVVADPMVSNRHFGIRWDNGHYSVVDLNSRNGVTLNGEAVHEAPLRNGDEIGVGDTRLTVSLMSQA